MYHAFQATICFCLQILQQHVPGHVTVSCNQAERIYLCLSAITVKPSLALTLSAKGLDKLRYPQHCIFRLCTCGMLLELTTSNGLAYPVDMRSRSSDCTKGSWNGCLQSKPPPAAAPEESTVDDDWEASEGAPKLRPASSKTEAKPKAADDSGPRRCVS